MNQYPENEYRNTQNMSTSGKLIRAQSEQIREDPAEYADMKNRVKTL